MSGDIKITIYNDKQRVMVDAVKQMAEILDNAEGETSGWINLEDGTEVGEWELEIK